MSQGAMAAKSPSNISSLEHLLKEIREGQPRPVYLIHGEERYQVESAAARLIEALLPEADRALNLVRFEGREADPQRIAESLLTYSFLPGRQVLHVVDPPFLASRQSPKTCLERALDFWQQGSKAEALRSLAQFAERAGWQLADLQGAGWRSMPPETWEEGAGFPREEVGDPEGLDALLAVLDLEAEGAPAPPGSPSALEEALTRGIPPLHTLIIAASSVDQRLALSRAIARVGGVLAYERGNERQRAAGIREVVQAALQRLGKRITTEGLELLQAKLGTEQQAGASSVEMLAAYVGDRPLITEDDIAACVGRTREDVLYDLTGALTARDLDRSLFYLKELLDQGMHPLQVHAGLVNKLRQLLLARSLVSLPAAAGWKTGMTYGAFQSLAARWKESTDRDLEGLEPILRLHPYPLSQLLEAASRFTPEELLTAYDRLFTLESRLKSDAPARLLLERWILELLEPQRIVPMTLTNP
ncbi:MAG: hypothetical protein HZA23_04480 [Nitrospirae bacterium]|nr:hypothetical protein [Nitrospirota bacterium]